MINTTMAEPCDKCGKLDANQCTLCNPTAKQAPIDAFGDGYRRGITDAFHRINMINVTPQGRTDKENCSHMVRTLAEWVNSFNQDDATAAPSGVPVVGDEAGIDECIDALVGAKTLAEKFRARNQLDIAINRKIEAVRASEPRAIMRNAFRVTEIEGDPDPSKQRFHMRFTFRSLEELHLAEDQWRAFVNGVQAGKACATENFRELLETIDRKAEAGLCAMTHPGTRAFLYDIRALVEENRNTTGV